MILKGLKLDPENTCPSCFLSMELWYVYLFKHIQLMRGLCPKKVYFISGISIASEFAFTSTELKLTSLKIFLFLLCEIGSVMVLEL